MRSSILDCLASALLSIFFATQMTLAQDQTLDNKAVIEMKQKGVSEDLIIEAIQSAPEAHFTFATDDFDAFSKAKLGPAILKAMYARSQQVTNSPTLKRQLNASAAGSSGSTRQPSTTAGNTRRDDEEFLHSGTNELGFAAQVQVPHSSASGTIGYFAVDYQRYITRWFSVGPTVDAIFLGSGFAGVGVHEIDILGYAQFSPRIGRSAYLVAGGGAGVANTGGGGFSSTHFVTQAYAGPRVFVSSHVALDIRYLLTYVRVANAGFKNSSFSSVTAGLSFFL